MSAPRFPGDGTSDALAEAVVRALEKMAASVDPQRMALHAVSAPAIRQALDDVELPHAARLTMWHLGKRLDVTHFREVKTDSLASEMRLKPNTVFKSLRQLVARGYLEEHAKRKPRAYRLPWSRLGSTERAA